MKPRVHLRKLLIFLGLAALIASAAILPSLMGHAAKSGHAASREHISSKPLVKLVAHDVNVTVASGNYDMTENDTTTPPTNCSQEPDPGDQAGGGSGTKAPGCQISSFPDISGHGTVDTNPYAMVTASQVGPLGMITLYDNGTNVWEIGGGDYGLAVPGQAGPGATLSGYASSVEGTLGEQAGALDMQSLASGTGYLDLEAQEIQGAIPAGTGTVDGVAVTIYKLSETGLQDPDLTGLTAEQVTTIRAADAIIENSGFSGKTTWVSVDAHGYIREVRSVYTLSDGSNVSEDSVLSNFGCAGTVLMPGQAGSTSPAPGCVSPDPSANVAVPATPTTTTPTTSPQSPSTSASSASPVTVTNNPSTAVPVSAAPGSVLPPPGPQPSDVASAEADVNTAFTTVYGHGPADQKLVRLQGGADPAVVAAGNAAAAAYPQISAASTPVVLQVVFTDATDAAVLYEIDYQGQPTVGPKIGNAILDGGTWKVTRSTYCQDINNAKSGTKC
jgi:hypothetical protein